MNFGRVLARSLPSSLFPQPRLWTKHNAMNTGGLVALDASISAFVSDHPW